MQGVGIKLFICRLAEEMAILGSVSYSDNDVVVMVSADREIAQQFYRRLVIEAPEGALILNHKMEVADKVVFSSFEELAIGETSSERKVLISSDIALCSSCRYDLYDVDSRNYRYPFASCSHCGPRFSIAKSVPFCREVTSFTKFALCKDCAEEFHSLNSANFSSETASCASCGPQLVMSDRHGDIVASANEKVISLAVKALADAKVVAIKDIGGYILLVDAASDEAVQLVHERMNSLHKPFSLIYPNLEMVRHDFDIEKEQLEDIMGAAGAMVLLSFNDHIIVSRVAVSVTSGCYGRIGVSIPHSPLLELVVGDFGRPVAITSANVIGRSPVIDNEKASEDLPALSDYIISHNLDIVTPQEESIILFSPFKKQRIVVRRSRGLAPNYFGYEPKSERTILSTGGQSQSTFAFIYNSNVLVSQNMGSTENPTLQKAYLETIAHFEHLLNVKPSVVVGDYNPNYFTHQTAEAIAARNNAHSDTVQHHKAHLAAVLAENNLLDEPQPILGVIWDSTGLGDDGNFWGGEFFVYDDCSIERLAHLNYFPNLLGEKMAHEPRVSALALMGEIPFVVERLETKFTEREWLYFNKFLHAKQNKLISSMGLVFDAVASVLDLCNRQRFDGQAQLMLEEVATQYAKKNGLIPVASYFEEVVIGSSISVSTLINGVVQDIQNSLPTDMVAYRFLYSMVDLVRQVALQNDMRQIVFSGSVFQNGLLVDLLIEVLGSTHQLYFHHQLAPNDECVSFGQLVYYDRGIDSIFSNAFSDDDENFVPKRRSGKK